MGHRIPIRVLLALALLTAQGFADDTKDDAGDHFDRGLELAREEAYEPALIEFQRAYELSHNVEALYNVAQAYIALGRAVAAVDSLTRYLSEGGKERRKEAQEQLRRQTSVTGEIVISVEP